MHCQQNIKTLPVCYYALRHEDAWRGGGTVHTLFADVLVVTIWSPSRSGRFIRWIGDWMGPRADLNDVKRKKSFSAAGYQTPIPQLYRGHYTE